MYLSGQACLHTGYRVRSQTPIQIKWLLLTFFLDGTLTDYPWPHDDGACLTMAWIISTHHYRCFCCLLSNVSTRRLEACIRLCGSHLFLLNNECCHKGKSPCCAPYKWELERCGKCGLRIFRLAEYSSRHVWPACITSALLGTVTNIQLLPLCSVTFPG